MVRVTVVPTDFNRVISIGRLIVTALDRPHSCTRVIPTSFVPTNTGAALEGVKWPGRGEVVVFRTCFFFSLDFLALLSVFRPRAPFALLEAARQFR